MSEIVSISNQPFLAEVRQRRAPVSAPLVPKVKRRRKKRVLNRASERMNIVDSDSEDGTADDGNMFTLPKPMLMRQPGPNSLRPMMRYPFEMVATIMMSPWASLFLTNMRSRLKLRTQYSGIGTFEWAFTMLERVCKIMGLIEDHHNFVILTEVCDLDTRCLQVLSTYDGETTTHQPCM